MFSRLIELSTRAGISLTKYSGFNNYDHILSLLRLDGGLYTSFCDMKKALLNEQECYRSRLFQETTRMSVKSCSVN